MDPCITKDGPPRPTGKFLGLLSAQVGCHGHGGRIPGERHAHGQDGGHLVQGGNEDADLTDAGRQQQCPRRLSVGFAMAKDLGTKRPSWGTETGPSSCLSPRVSENSGVEAGLL